MRYIPSTTLDFEPIRTGSGRGHRRMIVNRHLDGVIALAPAKVNLFLEIHQRRADGYHDLETLMVSTSLVDTLTIADDPSGQISMVCSDPTLSTGPDNLVIKAARRLKELSGTDRGARITLRKAIPMQAGLGGGSADAAATLAGLDLLWDLKTSIEQRDEIAASVGSDVAFFGYGPAAICRGRGEIVEPLSLPGRLHLVLFCPMVGVSTASVYRNLTPPDRPRPIEEILEALTAGDVEAVGRSLFNRLQPVAELLEPSLGAVRDALKGLGPLLIGSLMSGSGSAYFGLARDRDAAEDAASRLASLGLGRVQVVTSGP